MEREKKGKGEGAGGKRKNEKEAEHKGEELGVIMPCTSLGQGTDFRIKVSARQNEVTHYLIAFYGWA